jgi:hypothetical protein
MQPPHVIHPTAVYGVTELQEALRLKRSTLRREIRLGRLRVSKRAGAYFFLGSWVLQWIEGGELRRKGSEPLPCACPADAPAATPRAAKRKGTADA